jgi:hypothetical protein
MNLELALDEADFNCSEGHVFTVPKTGIYEVTFSDGTRTTKRCFKGEIVRKDNYIDGECENITDKRALPKLED